VLCDVGSEVIAGRTLSLRQHHRVGGGIFGNGQGRCTSDVRVQPRTCKWFLPARRPPTAGHWRRRWSASRRLLLRHRSLRGRLAGPAVGHPTAREQEQEQAPRRGFGQPVARAGRSMHRHPPWDALLGGVRASRGRDAACEVSRCLVSGVVDSAGRDAGGVMTRNEAARCGVRASFARLPKRL
jgi:hypothetical protein